jgi:hypothetical protein
MDRILRKFFIAFFFASTTSPIFAQNSCALKIGMNIASISDYGSENPFVDLMKSSRTWLTANVVWMDGKTNPWDSAVIDSIPCDAQGYPLELPYAVAGQETTQVVHTVWANTSSLQAGDYICLYDGDGEIDFNLDASIKSQSANRIVVSVQPNNNIMQLVIKRSAKANPVRNIRLLMPGTENTYQSEPYNPVWLQQLTPFKTIRFMDWERTNYSPNTTWSQRAHEDDYTWTTDKGIPYEEITKLCNTLHADAWVCIPHAAESEYITNMAKFIRDSLQSNLKVYVEYSNELWNWMFDQTHYLYENGNQNVEWPERIVPFIQSALDIWTNVFSSQPNRLVRVVGGQHYYPDVSRRISYNMRKGSFDAFSPAAYIGFGNYGDSVITALGSAVTPQLVLQLARREMDANALPYMLELKKTICDSLHVQLLYYEGGQHLTPDPFGSDQPYNQALEDAQNLEGIYTLYNDWFTRLRTVTDSSLFMNFSFSTSKSGKYGSWGVLEYIGQNPSEAPKYRALIDNLCTTSSVQELNAKTVVPQNMYLAQNYPNPFNPGTTIKFYLHNSQRVELIIFNALGQEVERIAEGTYSSGWHSVQWNAAQRASGVYFCLLKSGEQQAIRKVTLLK